MTIRAVLFDLFDTLAYVRPGAARAKSIRVAGEAGIPEDRWTAAWRSTLAATLRGEITSLQERVTRALAAAGMPGPPDGLMRSLVAARTPPVPPWASLYDDVETGLTRLRERGMKTALVSNIFPYEVEIVDRLGLRPLLDAVVLSCELGVCKPDPAIYLAAAERLSVEPQECVFVGDGMMGELPGARAVGMTAVRIDRSLRDDDEERDEAYDARVTTLPELLEWLAGWAPSRGRR